MIARMSSSLTALATREDDVVREVAQFLEVGGSALFSFQHLPKRSPINGGVVICSPIYAEFIRHYRREVIIARRLATAGFAVARFHYRGHGNSVGGDDSTYMSMRDDCLFVAEHLADVTGVEHLAFLGTRFGALPATEAASRYPTAPLAWWDPVISPSQYFRDIHRAQRVQMLRYASRTGDQMGGSFEQRLQAGNVQVLGYTITKSLFASTIGRNLLGTLGPSPRPTLLLHFGSDPRRDRGAQELLDALTERQWPIEVHTVGRREPWWFMSAAVGAEEHEEAMEVTLDWVRRSMPQDPVAHEC